MKQNGIDSHAMALVNCGRPKIRKGNVTEMPGKDNKLQDAMKPTVQILTWDRID